MEGESSSCYSLADLMTLCSHFPSWGAPCSLVRTSSGFRTQLHFTATSLWRDAHTRQVGQSLISKWLKGVLSFTCSRREMWFFRRCCAVFCYEQSDTEAWIVLSADSGAAGTVAMGETLRRGPLADCKADGSQCMSPCLCSSE